MARRFSRIRQAAYLSQAVDNYVQWIQNAASRVPNVGGGTPRPNQVELGIQPFNVDFDAASDVRFLARVSQPSRTFMESAVGTAAVVPGGAITAQKVAGWKPAKITLFVGTGTSTAATSAITGLRYLKYNGTNYAHPFGKISATDREQTRFNAIKTALAGTNRRFSLQSEVFRQI